MLLMKIILTMIISGGIVCIGGEVADNEYVTLFGAGIMIMGGFVLLAIFLIAIWSM